MAEPEVTQAAPNSTTGAAETIADVPDASTAEKAGTIDPVQQVGPSL